MTLHALDGTPLGLEGVTRAYWIAATTVRAAGRQDDAYFGTHLPTLSVKQAVAFARNQLLTIGSASPSQSLVNRCREALLTPQHRGHVVRLIDPDGGDAA